MKLLLNDQHLKNKKSEKIKNPQKYFVFVATNSESILRM